LRLLHSIATEMSVSVGADQSISAPAKDFRDRGARIYIWKERVEIPNGEIPASYVGIGSTASAALPMKVSGAKTGPPAE
jgi:hypothetical protein